MKKVEEPKDVRLTVAVSQKEAEYIRDLAGSNSMSTSELIRNVLVGMADF